jgi:hypothetical protein
LHAGPHNQGSAAVDEVSSVGIRKAHSLIVKQVFNALFPARFRNLLLRSKENLFFILSCGGVFKEKNAYLEMLKFAEGYIHSFERPRNTYTLYSVDFLSK